MANEFDPYREALVVETTTIWPDEYDSLDVGVRLDLEGKLHAEPEAAAELTYLRQHTGFARQITVTEDDLQRLGVGV
jgi:hypothetical protein